MRKYGLRLLAVCLVLTSIAKSQEVTLSDFLWQQTTQQQQASLKSPFIQGLKNASLNPAAFGAYNVQDSVYCYNGKTNIDFAVTKATEPRLKQFLQNASSTYESAYQDLFKEWHIKDHQGIRLGPACERYVNHLHDVATTMDPIYLVAALIPCAKLWPWLGAQINAKTGHFGVYTTWVQEELNPASHGYKKYEQLINEEYTAGHIDKLKALKAFTISMQGEADFFSSV